MRTIVTEQHRDGFIAYLEDRRGTWEFSRVSREEAIGKLMVTYAACYREDVNVEILHR